MFDPISIFYFCWILNSGLPPARLNVSEVVQHKETVLIVKQISKDITIREGL